MTKLAQVTTIITLNNNNIVLDIAILLVATTLSFFCETKVVNPAILLPLLKFTGHQNSALFYKSRSTFSRSTFLDTLTFVL
jgi:hypothetical protein